MFFYDHYYSLPEEERKAFRKTVDKARSASMSYIFDQSVKLYEMLGGANGTKRAFGDADHYVKPVAAHPDMVGTSISGGLHIKDWSAGWDAVIYWCEEEGYGPHRSQLLVCAASDFKSWDIADIVSSLDDNDYHLYFNVMKYREHPWWLTMHADEASHNTRIDLNHPIGFILSLSIKEMTEDVQT